MTNNFSRGQISNRSIIKRIKKGGKKRKTKGSEKDGKNS